MKKPREDRNALRVEARQARAVAAHLAAEWPRARRAYTLAGVALGLAIGYLALTVATAAGVWM